jgi:predicted RecA/RadA family phage recombinase
MHTPNCNHSRIQVFGSGLRTNHSKVMYGDGIGDIFSGLFRGIKRVFQSSGFKEGAKRLAKGTADSLQRSAKNYIKENKQDILNLGKKVAQSGIDIATEAGAKALEDVIAGENVKSVIKKRGKAALKKSANKAIEISKPELASQRRRVADLLRQERVRAYQQAQQEANNVESNVALAIQEEQEEIKREVSAKTKILMRRLGLGETTGNGLVQLGLSKKGKGLRQLGKGAGKKRGRPRKSKK